MSHVCGSAYYDAYFQGQLHRTVFGREPCKKYPVIYVLDANFYFGLVTEMTRIMVQCFEFPDTVIVGIGYPWNEPAHVAYDIVSGWRTRDFTPVKSVDAEAETLKFSPTLNHVEGGGAGKFLQVITEELIPWVEDECPVDSADRTLVGHSWGGLFALYALQHTTAFQRFVVCDPDSNYGNKILYEYKRNYTENHGSLPAKLFLSHSAEEEPFQEEHFASILEKRNYKDLAITYKEILNCLHCEAVAPPFQAGLKAVFG